MYTLSCNAPLRGRLQDEQRKEFEKGLVISRTSHSKAFGLALLPKLLMIALLYVPFKLWICSSLFGSHLSVLSMCYLKFF